MMKRMLIIAAVLFFSFCLITQVYAASCEKVVSDLNARLSPKIDQQELTEILRTLNKTNNKKLPSKFLSKREAQLRGWKPGKDLWSVNGLKGKSIGGDQFKNLERRLPNNKWREADLDYKGGHRGSKRLIFSVDGRRLVTVDHYRTFSEIQSCQ
ncbi:MAG: ribonuclease domain-containing protein [Smithella sp.]